MTLSPFVSTGQESGLDDRQFVARLRALLEDVPKPADEQGNGLGTMLRYNVATGVPINDDEDFELIVDGTPLTIVGSNPAPGEAVVNWDTGRIIFGSPPAAGDNNIVTYKNTVRWRDGTLLEALMDGARALYPQRARVVTDSTTIVLANLQWDYDLPATFLDPSTRLINVGIRQIPAGTNRFHKNAQWEQTGPQTIRIFPSQSFAPGSTVELVYETPYESLSEVDTAAQMLPIWYAAGMLLGFKEATRVRTDTANVASEANANPPGAQQNAGAFYMRQFKDGLANLPMRSSAPDPLITYGR